MTGTDTAERVRNLTRSKAKEVGVSGALNGGVAAVPVTGTAVAAATLIADLGFFAVDAGELILTVAALHGIDDATIEERRAWILSVLVFGDGASAGLTRLAGEVGKGLGKKATAAIPAEALRRINRSLGRTIVTKYGVKRGAIALGRLFPFGVGAAIGGGSNYARMRVLGRHADKFFRELPYIRIESASTAQ